jgi:hypothetical protein
MAGHVDTHAGDHAAPAIPTDPVNAGGVQTVALVCAAVGLTAFGVLTFLNMGAPYSHGVRDILFAYLVGFVLWSMIPLGSLFMMLIGIVTSASWGVVLRRCFTASLRTMWTVPILALPVIVSLFVANGNESPYWWSESRWVGDVETVAKAEHLRPEAVEEVQAKIADLLNPVRFTVVTAIGMVIIGTLTVYSLYAVRRHEQEDSQESYSRVRRLSGPGIVVWVLTMTVVVTIWVMSLEPTWASSMFPIVYGMDCFLAAFTFCTFVFYTVNANKPETMAIVKEKFRIDIGTLTLAITMVWSYATFSQYMLIWAGDLPEESVYYLKRGSHGWEYLAYLLMLVHFLFAFVALLFREVKTNTKLMRGMCVILFTVIAADVVWWVMPTLPHESGGYHVPMAVASMVGVGGVWAFFFARELGSRPALPANSEGKFLATWGEHH